MPRPLSWLPRLREIMRSVEGSVRSHYTRAELERLFQLQPRAAGKLIGLLPVTEVAGSFLVAREDLLRFLDRVRAADDVPALLRQVRRERMRPSQKKIRVLVRRDVPAPTFESLPAAVRLQCGELRIGFSTVVNLLESMLSVALLADEHPDEFTRRFQPSDAAGEAERERQRMDMRMLFEGLRRMEEDRAKRTADPIA